MKLERIEITGFKSFADKTIVEFDQGITAVVGPNGSGKSNLSEAIKWVLGEQSAKSLRGKKMDDIIFAGSQTRKPINFAEVTLVLNNEDGFLPLDFSEIQLTRRLHRNGESECFINKKPCRLKDIVNLLMDSGLGKDSFSIISQGKVETIFNNRPEDRRAMFEEVAGVLKYKTKKQEATRKLAKTQEHLDRVEDILHEIQSQLAPLAKQKEKAICYQETKRALSQIDVALLVAEVEALNEQFQVNQKEYHALVERLHQKEQQSQMVEQIISQLHNVLDKIEASLTQKQQEFVTLVQRYEQSVGQHKLISERLDFSLRDSGQQDEARFQKEQLIQSLTQQIDQLEQEKQEKDKLVVKRQQVVNQYEEDIHFLSESGQELIEKERQTYIEYLQEQSRLKNELINSDKNRQNLQYHKQKLLADKKATEEQLVQVESDLDRTQEKLVRFEQELNEQTTVYRQLEKKLADEIAAYQEAEQTLVEQQTLLNRVEVRQTSLKELTEDYAGFYQGVKEILKQKGQLQGIHGAVAELVKVPKKLTTAIDIALGASLQHVVTSDEKSARLAINYLKDKRLGRATFLPLTVIKPRLFPENIKKSLSHESGFIGIASDLVDSNTTYQDVISNLLGQTIIAETLKQGIDLAKKVGHRYRVVSLDGEIIHAGGSMTGGATKQQQSASLLSRQQELESLKQERLRLKDSVNALRQSIQEQKAVIEQWQADLVTKQQQGTQHRLMEKEEQHVYQKLDETKMQLTSQAHLLNLELENIAQQELEADTHQKALVADEAKIQHQIAKIKQHIDAMNSSQEDKIKQLTTLREKLQVEVTELAVLKEQDVSIGQQIRQYKQQLRIEKESLASISVQLEEHTQTREELEISKEQLEKEIATYKQQKDTVEGQLAVIQEQKKNTETELFLEETKEKDLQQQLQKLLKTQGNLETKNGRFEVNIDNHLMRLNEEYALTYEAAKNMANLDMTIQEASQQVAQLKREIEQLGLVNLAAIEEYDVVHERFIFMSEQQQDLLQAKHNLTETMLEMDEEMTRRFKETFYAIKQQFEKTFPKLFGGGRATLELTDPADLLETGIDIIAQPPGKKLQNLSLLSGGEKAFTAIALLFAILEVKPVPFCLLDEVEAALDEANVGRYGRYLKEFIEKTQFIVITHRKGTMEEANTLYGVTMQESGVSKLASVKFEDYV